MKIQHQPCAPAAMIALPRESYLGADWASSMLRPGCNDRLQHPSRHGGTLVFHRGHAAALPSIASRA